MSAPVNLNRVRKDKARAAKAARGDANAARHGLTKAERTSRELAARKAIKHLDDHKRDS